MSIALGIVGGYLIATAIDRSSPTKKRVAAVIGAAIVITTMIIIMIDGGEIG